MPDIRFALLSNLVGDLPEVMIEGIRDSVGGIRYSVGETIEFVKNDANYSSNPIAIQMVKLFQSKTPLQERGFTFDLFYFKMLKFWRKKN